MAAKSCDAAWPIFPWSFTATTSLASRKCRPRFITSSANYWRYSFVAKLELYGTASCPYTQEMREWLQWRRCELLEYDVEADATARQRLHCLAAEVRTVPVLVEDGN